MFNSYFAMLDAGYFGQPEPSDEWEEYIIDFKSMIDSFTDANFPRPGGKARLVSVSVMAEVRENSSVTYDVKDLTVLTGQSATDALETSNTMVHWQTAKGKSYTIAAICPDLCSIRIDGAITTFRGSKTITFTAPVDRDGSVAVGGAAWSGLFKQGYSSDGVCQPLWPMVDSR